jgi:soluble lytic murein transglycosylase-like protein
MPDSGKQHSYSKVLSAVMGISFSFSALGQQATEPPRATQSERPAITEQTPSTSQQHSIELQQQSVERQRSAVRQQVGSGPLYRPRPDEASAFQVAGAIAAPVNPQCAPVPSMVLEGVIQQAAKAYTVAPNLIRAVIRQESGGYPCAVSAKGAMGLMQLMPDTATEMGASEPFDVQQNVRAGTRFLSELIQRYKGDLNRVLGAYNAGPAAVDRVGGPPPFPETLSYIRSVMEQIKAPAEPKLFAPSGR